MIQLDSQTHAAALQPLLANFANLSLNADGMPGGHFLKALFFRLRINLTRGGAALLWEPEATASIVRSIRASYNGHQINISGNTIHLIEKVRAAQRISGNYDLQAADTSYEMWLPLRFDPIGAPDEVEVFRPLTDDVNGMSIEVTLGNPFAAADVATIDSVQIELLAHWSSKGGERKVPGGLILQEYTNFSGNVLTIRDYKVSLLLLANREAYPGGTNWSSVDGRSQGRLLYQNCFSTDLDVLDYEFNQAVPSTDATTPAYPGDPSIVRHPVVDAAGAGATQDYTKLFDARTFKGAERPYGFTFNQRVATSMPYILVGWAPGRAS